MAETENAVDATPLLNKAVADADREIRIGFIRKVYGILSGQMLLTVAVAYPFCAMSKPLLHSHVWMLWVAFGVTIASMCVMVCCRDTLRSFPSNYALLGVFTIAMGVVVGFTSAMYTWQSVILAAGMTTAIFLGMTVYAFTTKTDFTGYGPYMFGFMLCLCVFGFTLFILSACGIFIKWLYMLYNLCAVILFTMYIVYDTQLMIGGDHAVAFSIDDYCFAALNLYLDIINLFLALLQLFGNRN
mmetsp:Transcript_92054/g.263765  ORF Transcript_92054/g.263765 Transcript_92054/m.263765 type:complete len:243 (+) Transcript_92054:72-800(+)